MPKRGRRHEKTPVQLRRSIAQRGEICGVGMSTTQRREERKGDDLDLGKVGPKTKTHERRGITAVPL